MMHIGSLALALRAQSLVFRSLRGGEQKKSDHFEKNLCLTAMVQTMHQGQPCARHLFHYIKTTLLPVNQPISI